MGYFCHMKQRYLTGIIQDDLSKKMVFLGGPRQVGKTTLARFVAQEHKNHAYLNWDNPKHKLKIMAQAMGTRYKIYCF